MDQDLTAQDSEPTRNLKKASELVLSLARTTGFVESAADSTLTPVGIILGTGMGGIADDIQDVVEIPFDQIPGFFQSTVDGRPTLRRLRAIDSRHGRRSCR